MRWKKWIAVVSIVAMNTMAGVFGYWVFLDVTPPITVTSPPVVVNTPVAPSEPLVVRFSFKTNRQCVGYMNSWVVGDYYTHLGEARIGYLPKDHGQIEARMDVPKLPPGHYSFRAIIDYHCNPLQVITVKIPDAPFQIKETQPKT